MPCASRRLPLPFGNTVTGHSGPEGSADADKSKR
jgi:hypothetical protein